MPVKTTDIFIKGNSFYNKRISNKTMMITAPIDK
jgi:hypothetical protein